MFVYHEQRTYADNLPVTIFKSQNLNFLAHWHLEVEFIYVIEGIHKVGINQEVYTLKKGDFAICSSRAIHYYSRPENNSTLMLLIFKPEFIGYAAGWPQQQHFTTPVITRASLNCDSCNSSVLDSIEMLLFEIHYEFKHKPINYEDYIRSKILEICVITIRTLGTVMNDNTQKNSRLYQLERMQKALQFIDENYTSSISLKDIADNSNLSYYHFSRLFKGTVGMSYKEYINKRRIQLAEALLHKNEKSITQIAFECGFESTRTFYRAYKNLIGKPPRKSC